MRVPGPAPLSIETLVLDLLQSAAVRVGTTRLPAPGQWLDRVRDKLNESVNAPLRVIDLAREVGVHRVHLGRAFQARYGMCLGEYHRQVRVRWAAQQLAAGETPVGSIAIQAGFADHAHFSRVFKRAMGLTPLAYRRASRRD
jgi:AraC-like DNA-binding protein